MPLRAATILVGAALFVGCTSISSTMLNRLETDDFVGNSNGKLKANGAARPFKGVPITLRVPTHVDISIQEKVRFCLNGNTLTPLRSTRRHLWVETDLVYTDKVFTVDVKRPAAGTANYTLEFGEKTADLDNRQYFKNIKSRIVDETIKDVTAAINTVFSALPSGRNGEPAGVAGSEGLVFFEQTRTVAWKRFDVDMVDFEMQVAAFVRDHLNNCNSCVAYHAGADLEHDSPDSHAHSMSSGSAEYMEELMPPIVIVETPEARAIPTNDAEAIQ